MKDFDRNSRNRKTWVDIKKLLIAYTIEHTTEHHHATKGSVQIHCPFCKDSNFKLGITFTGGASHCWNCGPHGLTEILMKILHISKEQALRIRKQYSTGKGSLRKTPLRKSKEVTDKPLKLPAGTSLLKSHHKTYLKNRGFDPEELEQVFNLMGTGPLGPYKNRIMIPIYDHNKRMVSYQARDITGKCPPRYKNCKKEDELLPMKSLLYNIHNITQPTTILVVEGASDVWRLKTNTVATMGIQWTLAQANLLSLFHRIFIIFDSERQAQKQGMEFIDTLAYTLSSRQKQVSLIDIETGEDPGNLKQDDADHLVKSL